MRSDDQQFLDAYVMELSTQLISNHLQAKDFVAANLPRLMAELVRADAAAREAARTAPDTLTVASTFMAECRSAADAVISLGAGSKQHYQGALSWLLQVQPRHPPESLMIFLTIVAVATRGTELARIPGSPVWGEVRNLVPLAKGNPASVFRRIVLYLSVLIAQSGGIEPKNQAWPSVSKSAEGRGQIKKGLDFQ